MRRCYFRPGTGCTYSAAIAAGASLEEAIGRAKSYVTVAIAQHFSWRTERGAVIHALNHSVSSVEAEASTRSSRSERS